MLAIPLDEKTSTRLSRLYGNAPCFAIMDPKTADVKVIENGVRGSGPQCGSFLNARGVTSTLFYHVGEGIL